MKRYKRFRLSFVEILSLKTFWLYGSLYAVFALICLLLLTNNLQRQNQGIFDLIADISGLYGTTNVNMFIIVGIPLTVTAIHQLLEKNEKSPFVLRTPSRFHLWHKHVLSAIILSMLLTCLILIISFVVGGLSVGFKNSWLSPEGTIGKELNDMELFQAKATNFKTYKVILTIILTKFMGLLMIAFMTLFLKRILKNVAVIIGILIVISGFDVIDVLPFPIFIRTASLALINWLSPVITVYHCLYVLIVLLVFYAVTGWLYERKDFLS